MHWISTNCSIFMEQIQVIPKKIDSINQYFIIIIIDVSKIKQTLAFIIIACIPGVKFIYYDIIFWI